MKQFLLIKLNHIGDTLIVTPTLRFLKERYPEAAMDVIVRKGCEPVLEGNPDIRHLMTIARPERSKRTVSEEWQQWTTILRTIFNRRYDYGFDLSNSDKGKLFLLLANAKVRGVNRWHVPLTWKYRLAYNAFSDFAWGSEHQVWKDFRTVRDILAIEGEPGPMYLSTTVDPDALQARVPDIPLQQPWILVHPTSRWRYKQWLPERWAEVADRLHEQRGVPVIFSSGPAAEEVAEVEQIQHQARHRHQTLAGRLSLRELAWVIERSALFLGVDTVAMHMAAAVGTPTLALFGPSSEWSWHPWQVRHRLVLGACPCKQTRHFTCDKSGPYPCMTRIETEEVLRLAAELLDETTQDETDHG